MLVVGRSEQGWSCVGARSAPNILSPALLTALLVVHLSSPLLVLTEEFVKSKSSPKPWLGGCKNLIFIKTAPVETVFATNSNFGVKFEDSFGENLASKDYLKPTRLS